MPLPLPVVLATGNTDKAREIVEILVDHSDEPLVAWAVTVGTATFGYLLDGPDAIAATVENTPAPVEAPDVEETGDTLEANARIKASALAGALGVPAISDDTGLEVDALDGAPGVYSARYAGEGASYADNVDKLLDALGERADRSARFATVAMARWPDGREIAVRGEVEGEIAPRRSGPERVRLRPGVRTGGRRRPHVCGDEPGRETCVVTSGARVPPRSPKRSYDRGNETCRSIRKPRRSATPSTQWAVPPRATRSSKPRATVSRCCTRVAAASRRTSTRSVISTPTASRCACTGLRPRTTCPSSSTSTAAAGRSAASTSTTH